MFALSQSISMASVFTKSNAELRLRKSDAGTACHFLLRRVACSSSMGSEELRERFAQRGLKAKFLVIVVVFGRLLVGRTVVRVSVLVRERSPLCVENKFVVVEEDDGMI